MRMDLPSSSRGSSASSSKPVILFSYAASNSIHPLPSVLREALLPFSFAQVTAGDCFTHIDEIAKIAQRSTVLLYVDPFDVSQLKIAALGKVFENVKRQQSIGVIIVFMALRFSGWRLGAAASRSSWTTQVP